MTVVCGCCGRAEPADVLLQARTVRLLERRAMARGRDSGWSAAVCAACLQWLLGLVNGIRWETGEGPALVGAPAVAGLPQVERDQCHVCWTRPGEFASLVEATGVNGSAAAWAPLLCCRPCDGWLGSLATAGESARRRAQRQLDGAYGRWLHPNLRALSVAVDVSSAPVRAAIVQACVTMRLGVDPGPGEHAAVAFHDVASVMRRPPGGRATIVVARYGEAAGLRGALAPGVREWLTDPITPQQVTAALVRVARGLPPPRFDAHYLAPILVPGGESRPALALDPGPGGTPVETAWLARRFARGYDDVGVLGGQLVVVPHVALAEAVVVEQRLRRLLAGKVTVAALPGGTGGWRRFEAAG